MIADSASAEPILPDERERLFAPLANARLALCVSGGPDSMALMHLVAEWAERQSPVWCPPDLAAKLRPFLRKRSAECAGLELPRPEWLSRLRREGGLADVELALPRVVVLTVDHGLRPDSAREAAMVAREADRLGLPHQTLVWEGEKPRSRLQETARDVRYQLLAGVLEAEQLALPNRFVQRALVTAHHLEDQAETFLMRLARGSGVDGLAAMRPRTTVAIGPAHHRRLHSVLRPLLNVPKDRLKATLIARCCTFVEDPSNADIGFERVRVRQALDTLRELGITPKAISLSARRLGEAAYTIERRWPEFLKACKVEINSGLLARFSLAEPAASLDRTVGLRVLKGLLAAFGGASKAAELSQIEELYEVITTNGSWLNFKRQTVGGCIVERSERFGNVPIIYREPAAVPQELTSVLPGRATSWDGGRFTIQAAADAPAGATVGMLTHDGWRSLREAVPALADLRLPVDAMATQPAVWLSGRIAALPSLRSHLRIGDPDTLANVDQWCGSLAAHFEANFQSL